MASFSRAWDSPTYVSNIIVGVIVGIQFYDVTFLDRDLTPNFSHNICITSLKPVQ
jgi:hypothetical protein